MQTPPFAQPLSGQVNTTLEGQYLNFVLETLREIRWCFKDKDVESFSLYIDFLVSSILDEDTEKAIHKQGQEITEKMKADGKGEREIQFRIGFAAVRACMKYLNASLEIMHEDITGLAYSTDDLPADDVIDLDQLTRETEQRDTHDEETQDAEE